MGVTTRCIFNTSFKVSAHHSLFFFAGMPAAALLTCCSCGISKASRPLQHPPVGSESTLGASLWGWGQSQISTLYILCIHNNVFSNVSSVRSHSWSFKSKKEVVKRLNCSLRELRILQRKALTCPCNLMLNQLFVFVNHFMRLSSALETHKITTSKDLGVTHISPFHLLSTVLLLIFSFFPPQSGVLHYTKRLLKSYDFGMVSSICYLKHWLWSRFQQIIRGLVSEGPEWEMQMLPQSHIWLHARWTVAEIWQDVLDFRGEDLISFYFSRIQVWKDIIHILKYRNKWCLCKILIWWCLDILTFP